MALGQPQEELSILDAVDNLSSMVEVDAEPSIEGKIVRKIDWRDPQRAKQNQVIVKETFKVIHHYLQNLYEKNIHQLQEPETQRGIQAIMVLAKEAAQKLDRYTELFKDVHENVSRQKEYQDLQQFYLTRIMQKFQESLEKEESWKELVKEAEAGQLDTKKRELKDLETVRRDQHYELFLIKNEHGFPYFNPNLLSHIQLIGEFDVFIESLESDDPFLRFRSLQDRDVHKGAKEILELARPHIDEFYKEALYFKDRGFVSLINKALMGLMLTANSINLIENVKGKSCLNYYADFHYYLREALSSPSYSRLIAYPPEPSDNFSHVLMNLAHALCCFFFMRVGDYKMACQFLHRFIKRDTKLEIGPQMWESFLNEDEHLRFLLKKYPHGPILKTLELFKKEEEVEGFDPIKQGNYPLQLYHFFQSDIHVTILRLPSPTRQQFINKVDIDEEFKGLLRFFKDSNHKFLIVNFQDRVSWQEHSRVNALENLQQDDEFSQVLTLITLAKNSPFYLQEEQYQNKDDASEFKQVLKEQILKGGDYSFPDKVAIGEMEEWIAELIKKVHVCIFDNRAALTRKERLCFIELFYNFFLLKLIENLHCDSLSFTCKDALDTSAAANACFFSFLKLLTNDKAWTEEDKDFVLWLFYYFALMIRERAIDLSHFNRAITALAALHSKLHMNRNKIMKEFSSLYKLFDFNKIQIEKA